MEKKEVEVSKIDTSENPADAFTKALPAHKFDLCGRLLGMN